MGATRRKKEKELMGATTTFECLPFSDLYIWHLLINCHWYASVLYKRFLTPFHDGIWNRRKVSVGDRGGPSHMTWKPSGIGSLDAYSCPYITISNISNIPNASSLLLVCACIAIAVGVLWFYLNPGGFQARELSRQIPGTRVLRCGTSQIVHDYKPCTIGR